MKIRTPILLLGTLLAACSIASGCASLPPPSEDEADVVVVINNEYTYPVHIFAAPEFFGKGRYYRTDVGTTVREVPLGIAPPDSITRFPLRWRHPTIQLRGVAGGKRIIWPRYAVHPGSTVNYWLSNKTIWIGDRRR